MKTRLALLLCAVGVSGYAQSSGTFTATGSMTTARMGHTATLLYNGKVLIAGGFQNVPGGQNCEGSLHGPFGFLDCVTALNSAELYDPAPRPFFPPRQMRGA